MWQKSQCRYARDGGLSKRLFIYFLWSLESALATFRKVREFFVALSYDDGDISEDECLPLYDANSSKNPDFPSKITNILTWKNSTKVSVWKTFVFGYTSSSTGNEVAWLLYMWTRGCIRRNWRPLSSLKARLRRLSYPCRYSDLNDQLDLRPIRFRKSEIRNPYCLWEHFRF